MNAAEQRTVARLDFIARLAQSWDGRGNDVLMLIERRALWLMACLGEWPAGETGFPYWHELQPDQRRKLVSAARQAIELGTWARRMFGE